MDSTSTPSGSRLSAEQLLAQASAAEPGWSKPLGGPIGVIALCDQAQNDLRRLSEQLAALRSAGINDLLATHSGAEVAKLLGISTTAVSKARNNTAWENPTW